MLENNIKNTISDLINEIKTTTENNLSNLEQIMEALIDKVNHREKTEWFGDVYYTEYLKFLFLKLNIL